MHGSLLSWLMGLVILAHFGDIVVAKITEGRESEMLNILQYPGNSVLQKNYPAIVPPTTMSSLTAEISKNLMVETQRERTFL